MVTLAPDQSGRAKCDLLKGGERLWSPAAPGHSGNPMSNIQHDTLLSLWGLGPAETMARGSVTRREGFRRYGKDEYQMGTKISLNEPQPLNMDDGVNPTYRKRCEDVLVDL
ncbi:hypothetical protein DPEC_G00193390 [Dallia pectoralis]|uniref:Uncharacterized protein n=1 Tax=Dallia pectoralis TaxID=75939 RepID=A0ACC2G6S0_DALPE|nr:hypothetical protein DPEC_G00193390 [Dallia pectoralis]